MVPAARRGSTHPMQSNAFNRFDLVFDIKKGDCKHNYNNVIVAVRFVVIRLFPFGLATSYAIPVQGHMNLP